MAIESDGDLRGALTSFLEVAQNDLSVEFRTIHVHECIEVLLQRADRVEPLEPRLPSKIRNDTSRSSDPPAKRAKHVSSVTLYILYS